MNSKNEFQLIAANEEIRKSRKYSQLPTQKSGKVNLQDKHSYITDHNSVSWKKYNTLRKRDGFASLHQKN